jgi:hypothetical protein
MRAVLEPQSWSSDIAAFDKRNKLRPTRLEVLGSTREFDSDFWIEDGLLLAGIDLEFDQDTGPQVEIMLQSPSAKAHMTHSVSAVKRLSLETTSGKDGCLEIEDTEGNLTIMRFEAHEND